jgi:imidazolonepropionase-like amidohydrolase
MAGDAVCADHTLVVRDGRIEALGPSAALRPPADAQRIDATGWHLLPGLADMRVHLAPMGVGPSPGFAPDEATALARSAQVLKVYLLHGVTTVRNMAGTPWHLQLRQAVREGRVPGPRIHTTGPILETRITFAQLADFGQLVRTPEEARAAVTAQQRAGYDAVKVYNDIDADVYDEIVATCRELGVQVVGHVAYAKGLAGALAARQDSIEHFRSYDFALDTRAAPDGVRFVGWLHTTPARIREVAERTAEAGTWNVPTLVIEQALTDPAPAEPPPRPRWLPPWLHDELQGDDTRSVCKPDFLKAIGDGRYRRYELLAALDRAGAPLMAGSDCPGCGLVPGRSLLDELDLYVQAGLAPRRALRAATADAARFLGLDSELGTLAAGKLADVLVLRADPTVSLSALREPIGVMAAGVWHTVEELASALAVPVA